MLFGCQKYDDTRILLPAKIHVYRVYRLFCGDKYAILRDKLDNAIQTQRRLLAGMSNIYS